MRVLLEWTRIFFITVICLTLCPAVASIADAAVSGLMWKDVSNDIRDSDLRTVAVSPDNAETVYVSSLTAVYKTVNGGNSWIEILSFRGTGNTINSIAIDPFNTKVIYIGTRNSLYRSKDRGANWKIIFSGIGNSKGSILSIAINPDNPDIILIGTKAGVFRTDTGGRDWKRGKSMPSRAEVSHLSTDPSIPDYVYAATDKGIYKSINNGKNWERILDTYVTNNIYPQENNISSEVDPAENSKVRAKIRGITINSSGTETVYAFTSEGLIATEDGGLTWKALSSSGLISRDVNRLVTSSADPDSVYAATGRGVFKYSGASGNWTELYQGLTSANIRFLTAAPAFKNTPVTLWAATKKGVFKTVPSVQEQISVENSDEIRDILSTFDNEPSINEILKAAIRYAEVSPEKINGWRKAAAKKAWLPDLKVEYDKDKDWQSSDYFYSNATQKYKDDDITEGKDWGWSISVTWELGDLIWNDDQTSIDTRSRLMVQLRDDIMNEATRLYFERRRLQLDMLSSSKMNLKERVKKELRLRELTADIDALTGFYLSNRLART